MGAQAAVTENELDRQTEMNATACMIMVSAVLNQHFADYLNRPIPTDEWPELQQRLVRYFTTLEEVNNQHKDQLHDDPLIWSRFFRLDEIRAIQKIGYYRFDREIAPFVENLDGVIAEIERNIPGYIL